MDETDLIYTIVMWTMLIIMLPVLAVLFGIACIIMLPVEIAGWLERRRRARS